MVIKMAKCKYTGKSVMFGNQVSHSNRKTKHMQKPNLKKIKIIENGTTKKVWVSTTAIKSGLVTRA
jgi:large subunit ribosomal protein L28